MSGSARPWRADILGPDYAALDLTVPVDTAVPQTSDATLPRSWRATLVRHQPRQTEHPLASTDSPRAPVLFLHGWSDYFYNTGLAEFFSSLGHPFYALDLHNHGRSLQTLALGGYVADLADYHAEILAAQAVIADEHGAASAEDCPVILLGHSTGGLIAALWAKRFPRLVSHLILNSPWLEMQGGPAIRRAATPLVHFADLRPLLRMRVPERSFYWRGISNEALGEWAVDQALRPPRAFPVRAGWMKAILAAQQEVAAGLALPLPILVLLSSKSLLGPVWSEHMLRADVVLDVRSLALRTLSLGNSVTLERIDGALHEVFLSSEPVRTDAYQRLARWLRGYAH